jgi:hypothetical protein
MPTAHGSSRLATAGTVGLYLPHNPHGEAYSPRKAARVFVDSARASGEKKETRRSHYRHNNHARIRHKSQETIDRMPREMRK